ncbi:hypothetical protein TTHERM_000835488 (macronuclear) [Tetrahymena thermophila SB210]|uniref:Uncharacterized protein n=1 Tax=Tetrahymena thermophila (strain SB210) TaxID=312017 RepID=W7XJI6_TETTS|nr:hypothetical protein TTHERM_000835488 [Tetrahymena thermophila SB210]EWS75556.1 hypothetical protein TTHERM_000835488 [Tetrahymena thermophila SB210]|eukprot:XP_012651922.1 hypothetical protein TTHERM_000835488 [Tetrahymena thermophila SB210]
MKKIYYKNLIFKQFQFKRLIKQLQFKDIHHYLQLYKAIYHKIQTKIAFANLKIKNPYLNLLKLHKNQLEKKFQLLQKRTILMKQINYKNLLFKLYQFQIQIKPLQLQGQFFLQLQIAQHIKHFIKRAMIILKIKSVFVNMLLVINNQQMILKKKNLCRVYLIFQEKQNLQILYLNPKQRQKYLDLLNNKCF